MIEHGKIGFEYLVEELDKDGNVISSEKVHNIIPTAGVHHILSTVFALGAQQPNWYIGLFKGLYTPIAGDVMATFPANADEFTSYSGSTRLAFTPGAPSAGTMSNADARAEFTFTSEDAVTGGFIASSSGKGATTGLLVSAARFASPKQPGTGGLLRVTAGITLFS